LSDKTLAFVISDIRAKSYVGTHINNTMKPQLKTFNQALTFQLEAMYDAEKKIQKSFSGLEKKISSATLRKEVTRYLDSSADKRSKLKRVFSYLLTGPYGRKDAVMGELLSDVKDIFRLSDSPLLRDSMFIAAMQNFIHYKIAAYGTAKAFAEELSLNTVVHLLDQILRWEKEADKVLTRIAMQQINTKAGQLVLQS